ncbi:DsbA family protein [Streptomyces sp. NPDC051051]|uniref:mycothiol-dependent nitroreductase Rv2466c family protein n=1 Tax=Streptomyces sp. NPDC051051 TaxID=3155666 RepID=UPI003440F93F
MPTDVSPPDPVTVDFWFDPLCPWAWITSRWIHEVHQQRPLTLRWHVLSLALLNEGRDIPRKYREKMSYGPARVCIAAEQRYGPDVLGPLYTELGHHYHHHNAAPHDPTPLQKALHATGLDPHLATTATTTDHDTALHASHQNAIQHIGQDLGTPLIAINNHAFFGPVLTPTPRGKTALHLFNTIHHLTTTPHFYELKRPRTQKPHTH